jgi:hypothetical protein
MKALDRISLYLAPVVVVACIYGAAEALHHSGCNPFMAMPTARAVAVPVEPVPVSMASPLPSLSQGEAE